MRKSYAQNLFKLDLLTSYNFLKVSKLKLLVLVGSGGYWMRRMRQSPQAPPQK